MATDDESACEGDAIEITSADDLAGTASDGITPTKPGPSSLPTPRLPSSQKKKKFKRSHTKESEDNQDKFLAKLMTRHEELSQERKAMEVEKPVPVPVQKTPHEQTVEQFLSYLSTQLVHVKPQYWYEFTMGTQNLVHQLIMKGNSLLPPPPPSTQPPHAFNPPQQTSSYRPPSYTTLQSTSYSSQYGQQAQAYLPAPDSGYSASSTSTAAYNMYGPHPPPSNSGSTSSGATAQGNIDKDSLALAASILYE